MTRTTRIRLRALLCCCVFSACTFGLAGCWPSTDKAQFELRVTPEMVVDLAQNAVGVFLVSVEQPAGAETGPVALTVMASAGTAAVSSPTIQPGDVVELRLAGEDVPVDTVVTVTVQAVRGDVVRVARAEATITNPVAAPDDRLGTGLAMRDLFLPWLVSEHPELGITADTDWTPNPLRPHILEVSFYMFESAEWELVVWWHVMIPPYDWARMYLRHRGDELVPSFAAEISSHSSGEAPHVMSPPDEVWR